MNVSSVKQQEYIRRLIAARMLMLSRHGFFGLLMMHMQFSLDDQVGTAATDGERIYFDPAFLDDLSDSELFFVLMHEIMHVVLSHTARTGDRDHDLFNIACDIVVNSNILESAGGDIRSITLRKYGVSMHLAPDGKEGSLYTAEEVYAMLEQEAEKQNQSAPQTGKDSGSSDAGSSMGSGSGFEDDHSRWGAASDEHIDAVWQERIREAYEAAVERNFTGRGTLPAGIERALGRLLSPVTDWRVLLNDFIQEEIVDYSFAPPDRRFPDSPFFLPDFNETEAVIRNILFWIDTSGSMSEEDITRAYSEIKGAIDQFSGKLEGWLGFFDAAVIPPEPFEDEEEFRLIRPEGGGGTDFGVVFDYIRQEMSGLDIASIIIMTDGYAPFPDESEAMGIPVMWMINNDRVDPPWGRAARILS